MQQRFASSKVYLWSHRCLLSAQDENIFARGDNYVQTVPSFSAIALQTWPCCVLLRCTSYTLNQSVSIHPIFYPVSWHFLPFIRELTVEISRIPNQNQTVGVTVIIIYNMYGMLDCRSALSGICFVFVIICLLFHKYALLFWNLCNCKSSGGGWLCSV